MNLVKAQEYAASLPVSELKKYADGLNPSMIPPWLATGEMQAKEKRAEMLNNLQGAAQGEQPSVKEQIEKRAGLMGLQQAQMAQQQGAQAAPRPGGPVPEGTPEPEQQPQQEGGIDRLQSNIEMAGGGIVAFAGKGPSKVVNPDAGFWKWLESTSGLSKEEFIASPQKTKNNILEMFRSSEGVAPPPNAQAAQAAQAASGAAQVGQKSTGVLNAAKNIAKTKLLPGANIGIAAAEGLGDISDAQGFYDDPNVPMAEKIKQFARTGARTALPIAGGAVGSAVAPVAGTIGGAAAGTGLAALIDREGDALKKYRESQPSSRPAQQEGRPAMANDPRLAPNYNPTPTGPGANRVPGSPVAVPPQAIKPPAAPKPNPNAPAAPPAAPATAAPAQDSYEAMLRDSLKNSPKERTVQSIIDEQNAIDKALGLDVPAGKDKLERIAAIKEQYAATQMTPLQEFIAMLGQAGQSKGMSGLAPAYTSMEAQKRAKDLAMAERINELMGGVEDTQRGEKTATKTKVGSAREKDIENARLFDREKMQTLGTVRGQDVQAASSKYSADMSYKSAIAQINNANARQDVQEKRLLLDSFKTRIASIDKELIPLEKSFLKKDRELAEQLRAEKTGLTKALDETSGIGKMTGAPGAASPGGNTRMRFDAKGNPIK
jgi:hypothetical protein